MDGNLTVPPALGDIDARPNTRDVVVERNVDVGAIAGKGGGYGAGRASRSGIFNPLNEDLVCWWVRWLGRNDLRLGNWACDSTQEEGRKSEQISRESKHFEEMCFGY